MKLEKERIIEIAPGFFLQFDLSDNIRLIDKSRFLECVNNYNPRKNITSNLLVIFQEQFIIKNRIFIDLKLIKQKLQSFPLTEEKIANISQKKPNQEHLPEENTKISKPELKKKCCCGKEIIYHPRSLNKIPKRPKTQCSICKKWIYFNRHDVINFANEMIKFDLTNSDQLMTNSDQNRFGSEELVRKSANTEVNIDRKQVESISSHDQLQKNDQLMTNSDQFTTEQEKLVRKSPNSKFIFVQKFSIHKIRYKQDLISKPNWLFSIADSGKHESLTAKRVSMKNWDKFILYVKDYDRFSGLHNIEVCNNIVIYNFRHKREDCIVKSRKDIDQFFLNIQNQCQKARKYLLELGFEINSADPKECQKPHFVFEGDKQGNAEIEALNHISNFCEIKSKTPDSENMWDSSKGPETETDNKTGVQATLELAENIEKIQNDIAGLNNTITQMTQSQSQLSQFQSQMVQAQTSMANAITNLTNLMANQMTNSNSKGQNPGGMFN